MPHYDLIIAGGGAAGLSLAYQVMLSPLRNLNILIIDKDDDDQLNRNWGYWTREPTHFDAVTQHCWKQLHFESPFFAKPMNLGEYRYCLMHGRDFYRHALQHLAACPNVTFLRSVVRAIHDGEDHAVVVTDDGEYEGQWVFDSIVRIADLRRELNTNTLLKMHFKGWEIETPHMSFDVRAARLFDLRTTQRDALCFFYCMPFSETHAFIEYTVFSPSVFPQDDYEAALTTYLHDVLGVREYRILSEENGAVPLTDYVFPRRTGRHVMTIGAKAGRVKPSTGYSFLRVQTDSARMIASLIRHGHPFDVPPDRAFFRLCDALLLDVMTRHGSEIGAIFTALFRHNPIQRVFRFLDEVSTPLETVLLVATLPPVLFVEALLRRMIRRRQ